MKKITDVDQKTHFLQNGHTDCEALQCPKLDCSPAVQIEGDCCPRCMQETDACAVTDAEINPRSTCTVDGRVYHYRQHFHLKKLDRCTTCTCKVNKHGGVCLRVTYTSTYLMLFFVCCLVVAFLDLFLCLYQSIY